MDKPESPLIEPLLDYENVLKILGKIAIFGGLQEGELGVVLKKLRKIRYDKGDIIFRQGEEAHFIYIVKKGRVKMYMEQNNTALELAEFNEGDCFGETALIGIQPHSASVQVEEDTELIILSGKDLHELYKDTVNIYCKILLNISREACRRLIKTDLVLRHYVMAEKEQGKIQ